MNKQHTEKLTKALQNQYTRDFDCGNDALSSFIRSHEALDDFFGKTYIMLINNVLIGYYNIGTGHIEENDSVRMGGSIYINCLAIDKRFQKIRISKDYYYSDFLLIDCIERITALREDYIGFGFVTLSSTEEGHYLYKRNGFSELEDDMRIAKNTGEDTCLPMYLPIDYE